MLEHRRLKTGEIVQCIEPSTGEMHTTIDAITRILNLKAAFRPQQLVLKKTKIPEKLETYLRNLKIPIKIKAVVDCTEQNRDTHYKNTAKQRLWITTETAKPFPTPLKAMLRNTFHAEIATKIQNAEIKRKGNDETIIEIKAKECILQLELFDNEAHTPSKELHNCIRAMQSTYPALTPTIQTVKKWLAKQLLLECCIDEETVEWLCIAALKDIECHSHWNGFIAVLEYLAKHPFKTEPVIIDPEQLMKRTENSLNKHIKSDSSTSASEFRSFVQDSFVKRRKLDPQQTHCAIYLATRSDSLSKTHTWNKPSIQILTHLQKLSALSLSHLQKHHACLTPLIYQQVFTPNKAMFDLRIRISSSAKSYTARFASDLETIFEGKCICWYDSSQLDEICILFKPDFWKERKFKPSIQYPVKVVEVNEIKLTS